MAEVVRANVDTHEGHDSDSPAPFHKTAYKEPGIKVFANGEQVIREGDTTDCGDPAVGNISTVFANGKPLHLKGHATGGHGSFVANKAKTGSPNVFADNLTEFPINITPEHEAYLRQYSSAQEQNSEPLEYGDGGIPNGDGEFLANNTSPANGVSGPQQTPANTSSFKRTSDPRLNFLPHTDPTLEPELENKLIRLARDWGQTLVITSAYRNPIYNGKLKGSATKSLHMGRPIGSGKAMACDIVMSSYSLSDRIVFIEKAIQNGLRGIGVYNTFIHVDIGTARCWGSSGSRKSMPSRCPWARPILQKYGYATGPN
jgi:uncharacterized Zn-binding protein involved in type VI secretion